MQVIPKLSIGTFPDRVIASASSPVSENTGFNSNSDCYGDNFQVLCDFRAPPSRSRGCMGSPALAV